MPSKRAFLRKFNALMLDFDVIVLPTAPVSPFAWTKAYAEEIDGQSMDIYYRWLALTYRGSLTGGPSITLPCGRDPAMACPLDFRFWALSVATKRCSLRPNRWKHSLREIRTWRGPALI